MSTHLDFFVFDLLPSYAADAMSLKERERENTTNKVRIDCMFYIFRANLLIIHNIQRMALDFQTGMHA